jgi:hypothetical protein
MAKKLIDHEEAARMLGVSADELNSMRDRKQVFPKRDAGVWKYELDQIQRLADERTSGGGADDSWDNSLDLGDLSFDTESIVLSDDAPREGQSTVIGKNKMADPSASDVRLVTESTVMANKPTSGGSGLLDDIHTDTSGSDSLLGSGSLKLADDEIRITDSPSDRRRPPDRTETVAGDSAVQLGEEDELVLGSKPDSDITIGGGDSGISLVDPNDSGLSLEQPLELQGSSADSFDLGDEDIISLEEEAVEGDLAEQKSDDDFLLTPIDDATDDSDSSSQVIALDAEEEFSGGFGSSPAMLEEDLTASGPLVAPGLAPAAALAGAPMASAGYVAEPPYSGWNIAVLVICFLFMFVGGMFMYDLIRHMWSWGTPYPWNNSMMDALAQYLP